MSHVTATSATCKAFLTWADENGYTLADGFEWRGVKAKYPATCPEGHACTPTPRIVSSGLGGCVACGVRPAALAKTLRAKRAFLAWVDEHGYTLPVDFEWQGAKVPHWALCHLGHPCTPRPSAALRGGGVCWTCGNAARGAKQSAKAEAAYLKWVADNGYVLPADYAWQGATRAHPATCPQGHKCAPIPGNVKQGGGGCVICSRAGRDIFYVVQHPVTRAVKIGITSTDPRPRLGSHAREGYVDVLRTWIGLPGTTAPALERALLRRLKDAGAEPVRGEEYFSHHWLPVILSYCDAELN